MNAVWPCLVAFLVYFLGQRFYARLLAGRVFGLDDSRPTPAHRLRDEVDYLPTPRFVLFGHHFASITGLSPMLGPAIAVIWGWAPAMIWVVFGAVLVGCVHDFSALVVSVRARGLSIGKVAEGIIGARAKGLMLALIFFGVALAMGVFTIVISGLFGGAYGSAVTPSAGLMVIAAVMGWLCTKRGHSVARLTVVGFILQLVLVWAGQAHPIEWGNRQGWMGILLFYGFLASVLPVWSLLQPRDFLNSLLLYLGLAMAFIGFFLRAPDFAAPAFDPHPAGAPPFYPFIFITIACGAASGFHALVSSGTTAKQLDRESHAPMIGYGGMVGESILGLLAVLATTAGIGASGGRSARAIWSDHYHDWKAAEGLTATMRQFIDGAAGFVSEVGVPIELSRAFIAVVVVSFALTTLDSATRLLRYNVEEIGQSLHIGALQNRWSASLVAVLAIGFFAFYEVDGKPAGSILWAIFGTVNQLLAGLTLLTVTLYLRARGRNAWFTGLPMLFMLGTTSLAMAENLQSFSNGWTFHPTSDGTAVPWALFAVAAIMALLTLWLLLEAGAAFARGRRRIDDLEVFEG